MAQRGQRVALADMGDRTGLLVFAATGEFVAEHIVFLSRFVDLIARTSPANGDTRAAVSPEQPEVQSISLITGLPAAAVASGLTRYRTPRLAEQAATAWLGDGASSGIVAHLKAVIGTWRWAGRMQPGEPDLATAVAIEPVQMALGYQQR